MYEITNLVGHINVCSCKLLNFVKTLKTILKAEAKPPKNYPPPLACVTRESSDIDGYNGRIEYTSVFDKLNFNLISHSSWRSLTSYCCSETTAR